MYAIMYVCMYVHVCAVDIVGIVYSMYRMCVWHVSCVSYSNMYTIPIWLTETPAGIYLISMLRFNLSGGRRLVCPGDVGMLLVDFQAARVKSN